MFDDLKNKDSWYKLKLGEIILPNENSFIMRVPGGWIYNDMEGMAFIPFNNEFQ